jgi:hypothetical protein
MVVISSENHRGQVRNYRRQVVSRRRRSCPPPATPSQPQEHRDHDGHTAKDRESGLDAYIKELVDAAPPLTSEQRDTLALLLRRPRRR